MSDLHVLMLLSMTLIHALLVVMPVTSSCLHGQRQGTRGTTTSFPHAAWTVSTLFWMQRPVVQRGASQVSVLANCKSRVDVSGLQSYTAVFTGHTIWTLGEASSILNEVHIVILGHPKHHHYMINNPAVNFWHREWISWLRTFLVLIAFRRAGTTSLYIISNSSFAVFLAFVAM